MSVASTRQKFTAFIRIMIEGIAFSEKSEEKESSGYEHQNFVTLASENNVRASGQFRHGNEI